VQASHFSTALAHPDVTAYREADSLTQANACRVLSDPQSAALEAAKKALAARQVRLYDCYDIMVMCLYCDCRVTHWVTHAEKLFVSPALEPKYCFYVSC